MTGADGPANDPTGGRAAVPKWSAVASKILLAGLLLREAFSFWTGHPFDFEIWIRTGHAVSLGENPYAYWPPIPGVSIAYYQQTLPAAAYPPFYPLLLGGLYRLWDAVGGGNRFVLYFLLKQPPILGDVATAYLLHRVAAVWSRKGETAIAALSFWSFFPYAIIISAIWGQFDSLVVALVLLVFLARSPVERELLYGFGIFVKWITVIFLPLEAFAERGFRRAYVLLGLALPALATVGVFLAFGWGFTNVLAATASQSRGGGGGMSWVGIVTGFLLDPTLSHVPYLDFALSYLWVPAVLGSGWIASRWFRQGAPEGVLRAFLLVTTAWLLTRWGLYEQYLLYLFALAVLDLWIFHPGRRALARLLTVLAFVYLLLNNDFLIRFLAPLSPSVIAFTDSLDQNSVFGTARGYALVVLCVLVTVTLVQLLWTYLRDDERPVPWLFPSAWRNDGSATRTGE